jgi:transglutaminase-like putative cysteine protease
LGQGNTLTNEVKFWARPLNLVPKSVRLYWKARTYHVYDGQQWLSIELITTEWIPGEEKFPVPQDSSKWKTRFTVISSSFITTLFIPGQPVWIDREGNINHEENPDQTMDIFSFQNDPILRPGQDYVVEAELSNPTIQELKTAGVDYPDWIKDRYLQLPPTITERTKQLTSEITQGLETPFDKTTAIINFLRNPDNYTYQEIIPPPPADQDVVDWFLFDSRTGFCNYFASAAVVMLRQEGIPARLAVGYATGEKQDDGRYIVRQREAHAWPEVYFPNYGWVEFEPTTSQEPIERLPGTDPNAVDDSPASEAQPFQSPLPQMMDEDPFDPNAIEQPEKPAFSFSTPQIVFLSIFGLVTLVVIIFYGLKSNHIINPRPLPQIVFAFMIKTGLRPPAAVKKWADISSLPPLFRAYLEINNALSRLGEHPQVTSTPAERAEKLSEIIPPAKLPIDRLLHEYQIGFFSTQEPNIIVAYQSAGEIRQQSIRKSMDNLWQTIRSVKLSDSLRKKKKVL